MRFNYKFLGIALTAMVAGAFMSCSNELNESNLTQNGNGAIRLIKNPQMVAWSGNQTLSNTYVTRDYNPVNVATTKTRSIGESGEDEGSDNVLTWKKCSTTDINKELEDQYISSVLVEGQEYNPNEVDDSFLYFAAGQEDLTFHIYPVYDVTNNKHNLGIFYYDETGTRHDKLVWNEISEYGGNVWEGEVCNGREITIKAGYKFGFYWYGNVYVDYPAQQEGGWTGLVADYNHKLFTSSILNDATYDETDYEDNAQGSGKPVSEMTPKYIRAVTFTSKEGEHTYLGIEDGIDFDYQDVVFYCPETLVTVKEDNKKPGVTDEEFDGEGPGEVTPDPEYCDKTTGCGNAHHSKHEGTDVCEDCINEGIEDGCLGDDCPNKKPEVEGSGCKHTPGKHHWDSKNNKWVCDTCEEGESECKPETTTPPAGGGDDDNNGKVEEDPDLKDGGNEVEINLSINDYKNQGDIANLISKLSIHVRYAHDVKVTIPMAAKYYVDQDDLAVFNTHDANFFYEKNANSNSVTYQVGDYSVTLTVSYSMPENGEDGYITITTSGIDQKVLDYCLLNYGDGLNFEVYNYFAYKEWDEASKTYKDIAGNNINDLKEEYLDKATVEFVDQSGNALGESDCPNYYINAFGNRGQYNGQADAKLPDYMNGTYTPSIEEDCTVSIVSGQSGNYDSGKPGYHLNGTATNEIYKKNGVDNDSETNQHGHGFLWDKYQENQKNGSTSGGGVTEE